MLPVEPASSRSVCHQMQQESTTVCFTCGCIQSVLGGSGGEVAASFRLLQGGSTSLDFGTWWPYLIVPAQSAQSVDSVVQPDLSQEPVEPESAYLSPSISGIKEQGVSEAVAARIEAPQRGSTSQDMRISGPFLQSGATLIRWTSGLVL